MLQLPGLITRKDMSRMQNICDLLLASRLLLEIEHLQVPAQTPEEFPYNAQDPCSRDMKWIKRSRAIIEAILQEEFDIAKIPIGQVVDMVNNARAQNYNVTDAEIVQANIEHSGPVLLQTILQVSCVQRVKKA